MLIFKCKMCGGDIGAEEDSAFGTCDSCGTTSTLPKANDERIVNLFNRADHFRRQSDFDKALQAYENILNEDSTNAEAHWGIVLSRYGIEYVEDPATGQRVPTCHRVQSESILSDADYLATLENAPDSYSKSLYETEAQKISEIQKGILAISSKEAPYDVFICYKETTNGGSRTKDSTLAQDIYHQLDNAGYKVFFARLTLEGKLGEQYEPYIFNALTSAKVMLVIGTKPEFFNAIWVKNEWSRFLALVKKDKSRLIIPCYRDMDAYDIPDELSMYQSQDMSKIGFIQDLIHGVKKVLDVSVADEAFVTTTTPAGAAASGVESLMKRGHLFLEDSDWKQANEYFDKVLDIDPEHASAYIGKLFTELNIKDDKDFLSKQNPLPTDNANYQKALRFADNSYRAKIEGYNNSLVKHVKNQKTELENVRKRIKKYQGCISYGLSYICALKSSGRAYMEITTTELTNNHREVFQEVKNWRDLIAISAQGGGIVGLTADGKIVSTDNDLAKKMSSWRDIKSISVDNNIITGLKSNGTVVAEIATAYHGKHDWYIENKNEVLNEVEKWRNIVAICAGGENRPTVLGLRSDGTCVTTKKSHREIIDNWREIVAIADIDTVLKSDGTVVSTKASSYSYKGYEDWRELVAISSHISDYVGLKADGTVVTTAKFKNYVNVSKWSDIVAISCGLRAIIGLTADGKIVSTDDELAKKMSSWRDVGIISEEKIAQLLAQEKQRQNEEEQRKAEQQAKEKQRELEENKLHKELTAQWVQQGLCGWCGSKTTFSLKGPDKRMCKFCGMYNPYQEKIIQEHLKLAKFMRSRKCSHCGARFRDIYETLIRKCWKCGKNLELQKINY